MPKPKHYDDSGTDQPSGRQASSLARYGEDNAMIYEFDLNYRIKDQIVIPNGSEKYIFSMSPFVDRQGRVYEFRFMDDGLHVIKWTKE